MYAYVNINGSSHRRTLNPSPTDTHSVLVHHCALISGTVYTTRAVYTAMQDLTGYVYIHLVQFNL
jgi:hypothetical protein